MTDISFSDIYFENGVYYTDSLKTTVNYFLTSGIAGTCPAPKIHAWDCSGSVYDINRCFDSKIKEKESPTILGSATYRHTAKTTKNDFVALYNEQYTYNVELFIGIVVISLVLSKMVFYPMKL